MENAGESMRLAKKLNNKGLLKTASGDVNVFHPPIQVYLGLQLILSLEQPFNLQVAEHREQLLTRVQAQLKWSGQGRQFLGITAEKDRVILT